VLKTKETDRTISPSSFELYEIIYANTFTFNMFTILDIYV